MRVLSFIPAFLLAAASFVAAAPTPSADTSCVSNPTQGGSGSGNDAALQPIISIIAGATTRIQPLSDQLGGLKGDSCTPDAVSSIVTQIDAVVSDCVTQLQAAAKIDLTNLDLTNLCATIYAHLTVVLGVLNILVSIMVNLGVKAVVGSLLSVVTHLLNVILSLVTCLEVYVNVSVSAVVGPVTGLVCGAVKLLISICAEINLGVN